jgi:copper resistance protein C
MKTLAALLALPALAFATAASAHAHLHSSSPAEGATVPAPAALHLEFSEKLEAKFSGVELKAANGAAVPVAAKVAGAVIDAKPKAKLAPGAYTADWHVLSVDGHKSSGKLSFTVK